MPEAADKILNSHQRDLDNATACKLDEQSLLGELCSTHVLKFDLGKVDKILADEGGVPTADRNDVEDERVFVDLDLATWVCLLCSGVFQASQGDLVRLSRDGVGIVRFLAHGAKDFTTHELQPSFALPAPRATLTAEAIEGGTSVCLGL